MGIYFKILKRTVLAFLKYIQRLVLTAVLKALTCASALYPVYSLLRPEVNI